jgi:large subunit ribosomal protein L17
MRHKIAGRKLNRTSSHRAAMLSNMAADLLLNEQIKTTLPKAKELRPFVERLVTKARDNSLHSRRYLLQRLKSDRAVQKLLSDLGPRYNTRPGGYLRIIKAGFRHGDMAPIAYIEFVNRDVSQKGIHTKQEASR